MQKLGYVSRLLAWCIWLRTTSRRLGSYRVWVIQDTVWGWLQKSTAAVTRQLSPGWPNHTSTETTRVQKKSWVSNRTRRRSRTRHSSGTGSLLLQPEIAAIRVGQLGTKACDITLRWDLEKTRREPQFGMPKRNTYNYVFLFSAVESWPQTFKREKEDSQVNKPSKVHAKQCRTFP